MIMFGMHHHKSIDEQMKDNRLLVSTGIYGIKDSRPTYEMRNKELSLGERLTKSHLEDFNTPQKFKH